jgi:hypothetical protein
MERLLAELSRELEPLGRRGRRRALAEARDHLLSAIEDEVARGATWADAEQRVTARFGEPALIAESLVLARPRSRKIARIGGRCAVALAIAAAALIAVRLGLDRGSTSAGTTAHRTFAITLVLLLAGLPLVANRRRVFGPVGDSRAARLVRIGAYGALCVLPLVVIDLSRFAGARFDRHTFANAADKAQWQAERVHAAVSGSIVLFVLMAAYAGGILWITSRRSPIPIRTPRTGVGSRSR